jgi:CDP-diacylglycerol--glycerol-3-phosphate 3-phosphatidyltransferase
VYSPGVAGASKPLITANMVTAVRLFAMPVMAWLIYAGYARASEGYWWTAFALGAVVASTDFVDGWLARRHGPTVLGGLLDPIADKVFIALSYLPFMDLGIFPAWAVGLLFVRDFLVTAMRSAYEWRGLRLETSYLAKVKTWVQMHGLAMFLMALLVSKDMITFLVFLSAMAPLVPLLYVAVTQRRFFRSAAVMSGFLLLLTSLYYFPASIMTSIEVSLYIIAALTWLSGLDYLVIGLPKLYEKGGFHRGDVVRLFGALAIPVTATLCLVKSAVSPIPAISIIAIELAVGGLDNLLSHHKSNSSAWTWSTRTLGTAGLLGLCLALPEHASLFAWAALGLSFIGVSYEFWRGRDFYLDEKTRDEAVVA